MKDWNKLYELGNALESAALSFVIRVGPWLGPAPTAFLVYERTRTNLQLPPWVSVVTGLTLEFLGVASSATAFKFWVYNSEKLKSEPRAPTKLALGLTGLYFCAALFLTLVLDTLDGAAKVAPIAFVVLSLASVSLLALRLAHASAFMTKGERKAARKAEKSELAIAAVTTEPVKIATKLVKKRDYLCWCGKGYDDQRAYAGHVRKHRNEARAAADIPAALATLQELYPNAWDNGGTPVTAGQVEKWRR